jgi:hypothetical protein
MAFGQGGAPQQQVISTLDNQGRDVMGLGWPGNIPITLTVESNHFCVLKSRGTVFDVHETGQHQLTTPGKPILGNIAQGFFGGNSPWQYEATCVQRSKLLLRTAPAAVPSEISRPIDVSYLAALRGRQKSAQI